MIVKIDHVAFSSLDFKQHIGLLESFGYELRFVDRDVRNPIIKKELMGRYCEDHDLALLDHKENIPIELLNHRTVGENEGYITPIFKGLIQDETETTRKKAVMGDLELGIGKVARFGVRAYLSDAQPGGFGFDKIIITCEDIEASMIFWKKLGFEEKERTEEYAFLEFSSIISKGICGLYLMKGIKRKESCLLDDRGFNCLALISTSVEREKQSLEKDGFYTTDIEDVVTNGKKLRIFFGIGPSGEIIEMIELVK